MPLDRSPGIDEETIRVTSRFAVVRPVARMRPLEKHRHRAAKRLDVVVDIAERGPDVFRRMALATEPGERGLAEFERRFHRTSLARKAVLNKQCVPDAALFKRRAQQRPKPHRSRLLVNLADLDIEKVTTTMQVVDFRDQTADHFIAFFVHSESLRRLADWRARRDETGPRFWRDPPPTER